MKIVTFIAIFCVFHMTAHAWVAIIPYNSTIKHDGYCYNDKTGTLNKNEERRIEGECVVATCLPSKDITLTGCGAVAVEPPCKLLPGNLSKPYPDCCFEIVCPGNELDGNQL